MAQAVAFWQLACTGSALPRGVPASCWDDPCRDQQHLRVLQNVGHLWVPFHLVMPPTWWGPLDLVPALYPHTNHPREGADPCGWEVLAPQWGRESSRGSHGLSGKAGIDEVMAAAVLTSLSASPLVLGHPPATHATEPGSEVWKEAPAMSSSCSSSSNASGDWSWDPSSDRSTPSTPSPPLSSHPDTSLLQNSTKVMFKCLWKSCGKVLSSSSGMQKHIRTMHLGRKADLEQSDGEEDFYYTELDVDMEALTDGLSSLTPVSPTSSVPPTFPGPEAPLPPALPILELALASPCSPPGPPGRCHLL
uniref:C2H2-type domain-containing protein n=1 Tax=Zonotrichia albicollis TaxID=44394 RepID=A0A8D2M627_ZONAL